MTRVSENQVSNSILLQVVRNREAVNKYSQQVSSGLKVTQPGDSTSAGTIAQFQGLLDRIEGYKQRGSEAIAELSYQDKILEESSTTLTRAMEIATQAANETLSSSQRSALAEEALQLRDHLVSLANTKYQGRYIYAGAADNQPAFSPSTPYPVPTTGPASQRYVYTTNPGGSTTHNVQITDDLQVVTNTPGNTVFANSVYALERLGRALKGYSTTPATGQPTGGAAYNLPTDYSIQTADIKSALTDITNEFQGTIIPERANVAGRLKRVETAGSILDLVKSNTQTVLGEIQDTDMTQSATSLAQAQTALQASLTVTAGILQLSILKYI